MLVSCLKMFHSLDRMLIGLLNININPINQTSLLNDQVIQLLVNPRQLIYRLNQLMNPMIFSIVTFPDLQHFLLYLEHFLLFFSKLDGPIVA
jgi:hypothetical protein